MYPDPCVAQKFREHASVVLEYMSTDPARHGRRRARGLLFGYLHALALYLFGLAKAN